MKHIGDVKTFIALFREMTIPEIIFITGFILVAIIILRGLPPLIKGLIEVRIKRIESDTQIKLKKMEKESENNSSGRSLILPEKG